MYRRVLYRHPTWSTVAFEVLKSFYVKEKNIYKLKVNWWNIGACHKPWNMRIEQKLQITPEKLKEFVEMQLDEKLSQEEFDRLCTFYKIPGVN